MTHHYSLSRLRAKPGFGVKKKELLAELKLEESCLDHWCIMCATTAGYKPNPEWVAGKKACEGKIAELVAQLEAILFTPPAG